MRPEAISVSSRNSVCAVSRRLEVPRFPHEISGINRASENVDVDYHPGNHRGVPLRDGHPVCTEQM